MKKAKKKPTAKKKVVKKLVIKKKARIAVKAKAKPKPKAKAKAKPKPKPVKKLVEGKLVGEITHYFPRVRAAVMKVKIPLFVGDQIKIKGHTTDFNQKISSIQINHVTLAKAKPGDEIGFVVESRVRRGDIVTKCS